MPARTLEEEEITSTRRPIIFLLFIFILSLASLMFLYFHFPAMTELALFSEEKLAVKLPLNMDDAKEMARVFSKYRETNYYMLLFGILCTFIFLQTFAVPGSIFLSVVCGFLFKVYVAMFTICFCSAVGASLCYCISDLIGRPLVMRYFPSRIISWKAQIQRNKEFLFNYILFLRITPFLPNWFINLASPILKVPLSTFATATFIGVAPLSFLHVTAGQNIYNITSTGDSFSWINIFILVILAFLSILPVILKRSLSAKFD